jgi:hypothetical protein
MTAAPPKDTSSDQTPNPPAKHWLLEWVRTHLLPCCGGADD